jgi:hypothetical protein
VHDDVTPTCPHCSPADPAAAFTSLRELPMAERLVDESHFDLSVRRCPRCGQAWVAIFTELLDWRDGDDSQAWLCLHITDGELRQLRAANEDDRERTLVGMNLSRRHLAWVHPRGNSESVSWKDGPLVILPHD